MKIIIWSVSVLRNAKDERYHVNICKWLIRNHSKTMCTCMFWDMFVQNLVILLRNLSKVYINWKSFSKSCCRVYLMTAKPVVGLAKSKGVTPFCSVGTVKYYVNKLTLHALWNWLIALIEYIMIFYLCHQN